MPYANWEPAEQATILWNGAPSAWMSHCQDYSRANTWHYCLIAARAASDTRSPIVIANLRWKSIPGSIRISASWHGFDSIQKRDRSTGSRWNSPENLHLRITPLFITASQLLLDLKRCWSWKIIITSPGKKGFQLVRMLLFIARAPLPQERECLA